MVVWFSEVVALILEIVVVVEHDVDDGYVVVEMVVDFAVAVVVRVDVQFVVGIELVDLLEVEIDAVAHDHVLELLLRLLQLVLLG